MRFGESGVIVSLRHWALGVRRFARSLGLGKGESVADSHAVIEGALEADVLLVAAVSSEWNALRDEARAQRYDWVKVRGQSGSSGGPREYRRIGMVGRHRVVATRLPETGSFSPGGSAFTCYEARLETSARQGTGDLIPLGTAKVIA